MKLPVRTWLAVAIQATSLLPFLASTAPAAVETRNLIRNGDFNEGGTPPPGWTIDVSTGEQYELTDDAFEGTRGLKVTLPVAGGSVIAVSAPCPVTAGDDYLFTYWTKRSAGSDAGGVLCAYILWQDGSGKQLDVTWANWYAAPVPDYRAVTYLATAPTGAVQAAVKVLFSAQKDYTGAPVTIVVDHVRLTKMSKLAIPAHPQTWEYSSRQQGPGSRFVADKDTADGQAIVAEAGTTKSNTYLAFGPYTHDQPIGEYLAIFRLKVKDNAKHAPVVHLMVDFLGNLCCGASRMVLASDFQKPGVYQDIAVRFVRAEEGAFAMGVRYQGTTDLSYDKLKIVQLASFATDQEQAAIWLGGKSAAVSAPAAPPAGPAVPRDTVLVLAGLGHELYVPSLALPHPLKLRYSYLARIQSGTVLDQPFPKTLDDLRDVGLIVLADVPVAALGGMQGRTTLQRFVEQGGGLLVFGGPFSLGKGGYAESVLASVLPVTLAGPWDLKPVGGSPVRTTRASPMTDGLNWNPAPVLQYCQKTIAKPDAETLLTCGDLPVLVTGRYGKGRVAVFAGNYLGEPAANRVLFYQWSGYPDLLGRIRQWLLNG